jgi:hypothetical protein
LILIEEKILISILPVFLGSEKCVFSTSSFGFGGVIIESGV